MNTQRRPRHIPMEIQILILNRHTHVKLVNGTLTHTHTHTHTHTSSLYPKGNTDINSVVMVSSVNTTLLPLPSHESVTRKAIFWSVTVYNNNNKLPSQYNLTAQMKPVQDTF